MQRVIEITLLALISLLKFQSLPHTLVTSRRRKMSRCLSQKNVLDHQEHVDSSIAEILLLKATSKVKETQDGSGIGIQKAITVETLVDLALHCDKRLYDDDEHDKEVDVDGFFIPSQNALQPKLQALHRLGNQCVDDSDNIYDSEQVVAATMFGLLYLESSIRQYTGFAKRGKAPLLSQMIAQIPDSEYTLRSVLECLLLPKGVNLRNLLWHGFCGTLARPWLSLVLVLTNRLSEQVPPSSRNSHPEPQRAAVDSDYVVALEKAVEMGTQLRQNAHNEFNFIAKHLVPPTHQPLFDLATSWVDEYPACALALLTVILEHGLRLEWCRVNDRPQDTKAHPNQYYVTLDGHGQRNQHELLLHPYVGQPPEYGQVKAGNRNGLVPFMGSSTIAMLSDLFCSAAGPNIRAALSHGIWDHCLEADLERMHRRSHSKPTEEASLQPMVSLVVLALYQCAVSSRSHAACKVPSTTTFHYVPKFSFTAMTRHSLESARSGLDHLYKVLEKCDSLSTSSVKLPDFTSTLLTQYSDLNQLHTTIGQKLEWHAHLDLEQSGEAIFQELEMNRCLASQGAVRSLLEEISVACSSYAVSADEAIKLLQSDDASGGPDTALSSRQRKRAIRLIAFTRVAYSLYGFATFVALTSLSLGISHDGECVSESARTKAVERSTSVVSTSANMLAVNAERAFKSMESYSKAKVTKPFLGMRD